MAFIALDAVGESSEDHAVGQAAGLKRHCWELTKQNTMVSRFYNNG